MRLLLILLDWILPLTLVVFGLYYCKRLQRKKAGKPLLIAGISLCILSLALRFLLPLEPIAISLINNTLSLLAFSLTVLAVSGKKK